MVLTRTKWKLHDLSHAFGALFYSTEALASSSTPLHGLILMAGDPMNSMTRILDQWVEEGQDVKQSELRRLIMELRKRRRFKHALQLSEWMSNERNYELWPGDIATRLNLISKVHGLEQAERYFSGIPDTKKEFRIYAALLSCYAEHDSLEQAEAIMQKIKEYNFVSATVCYNIMLKLYAQMGKYEKMDNLMQEMKEKEICSSATYSTRLNSYVTASDIEGMEKFLMQMEADPLATVNWLIYIIAAKGYLKAGHVEKALAMLNRTEQLTKGMRGRTTTRVAYESLLTMYAALGNKDGVYRIWNRCNKFPKQANSAYICMLSSLCKLGDIDGAERILEEWESGNTSFDRRIPNLMINAYCKKGLVEKAEAYIRRLLDSGKDLDGDAWDRLAYRYCLDGDMEKAVQTTKKALSVSRPGGWRPNPFSLAACIEYMKEKGDLGLTTEILTLVTEQGNCSAATCDRLLNYVHSEIPDTNALDLMKGDYQLEDYKVPDGWKQVELELKEAGSS